MNSLHVMAKDDISIDAPLLPHFVTDIGSTSLSDVAKLSALAFFIWSGVVFITTEPHNKPVRYSFEEIKRGQNLWNNFKYLILDGLIGHKSKRPSIRIYPDGKVSAQLCETFDDLKPSNDIGKVILRPGAWPKGIYGWTYEYGKPTVTMFLFLMTIKEMTKDVEGGFKHWCRLLNLKGE